MLHLLPEYQKRKVLTEYRLRLTVVLILLVATAVLMFAIFLMPSYVYLYASKSELVLEKQGLSSIVNARSASSTDKAGGDAGKAIASLKPFAASLSPLLYVDALIPEGPDDAAMRKGIRIHGYFMTPISDTKVSVAISGIADSRENLSKYAAYLNGKFGGVKLPLSSLAKQGDIPFDFKFEADKVKLAPEPVLTNPENGVSEPSDTTQ